MPAWDDQFPNLGGPSPIVGLPGIWNSMNADGIGSRIPGLGIGRLCWKWNNRSDDVRTSYSVTHKKMHVHYIVGMWLYMIRMLAPSSTFRDFVDADVKSIHACLCARNIVASLDRLSLFVPKSTMKWMTIKPAWMKLLIVLLNSKYKLIYHIIFRYFTVYRPNP